MFVNELNEREREIVNLLAEGLANKEIANRLFLAPNTVKWYIKQLNSKFGTSNRDEIVQAAQHQQILSQANTAKTGFHFPKSNLPRQSTAFVGRDAELDELHSILEKPEIRLITILAQGGMGKTRFALEAAEQQQANFRDGVFFVALQSLSDSVEIIPSFAESLAYFFQSNEKSPKAQLLNFLADKEMLLITDNWEHLLDGVGILNEILQAAPNVKILATSREKLQLLGETVYLLQGMEFPSWESPEDALEYDAVQLLVQTAHRVKPDWRITKDNLDFVSRVCRLTEGMPLGILLAVSWLDMLSIREIADEIQANADFLQANFADVSERQQSIRAIFNTAWTRLSAQEQDIFMKLSIFRGGFSREAAKAVAGASLQSLHRLIEKALLIRLADDRYHLHELLRQYAEEKLKLLGEEMAVRQSHASYYLGLVAGLNEHLKDSREKDAYERITQNFENIRVAWFFSLEKESFEPLLASSESLLLVADLGFFWHMVSDCISAALQKLEERGERDSLLLARFLLHQAACNWALFVRVDSRSAVLKQLERPLEILEAHQASFETYYAKNMRIRMSGWLNQKEQLLNLAWEAHEIAKTLDSSYYLAVSFQGLFAATWYFEAWEECLAYTEKAYALYSKIGHPSGIARQLLNFGLCYWHLHDLEKAEAYLRQALSALHNLGFVNDRMYTQFDLTEFLYEQNELEEAERHAREVYEHGKYMQHEVAIKLGAISLSAIKAAKGFYQEALDFLLQEIPREDGWKNNLIAFLGMAGEIEAQRQTFRHWMKVENFDLPITAKNQIRQLANLFAMLAEDWGARRALAVLSLILNHPHCPKIYTIHAYIQKCLHDYRATLGNDAFEAAWGSGKDLRLDEVFAEIQNFYRNS